MHSEQPQHAHIQTRRQVPPAAVTVAMNEYNQEKRFRHQLFDI